MNLQKKSRFEYLFLLVLLGQLCLIPALVFAQDELPLLGAEIRPLIPSALFDVRGQSNFNFEKKQFTLNAPVGYSAGASIRLNLSKIWNIESGLYYTSRTYRSSMTDSGAAHATGKVIFDNYEIPALGLIYIKLSKHLYLNNAFGVSLDFFPTDATSLENAPYYQKIARSYWVLPALLANVGAEYRTKNNGYFYVGAIYHRMLVPLAKTAFFFDNNGFASQTNVINLQGHYFAIDFKFYFPNQRTPEINNGVGYLGY